MPTSGTAYVWLERSNGEWRCVTAAMAKAEDANWLNMLDDIDWNDGSLEWEVVPPEATALLVTGCFFNETSNTPDHGYVYDGGFNVGSVLALYTDKHSTEE